jgi:hypothetical protein
MRFSASFSAKGITGIGAIAAAIAFAGCECTVGHEEPRHPPPPPPPPAHVTTTTTTTTTAPTAASLANPPPPAPLPASIREKLEKKDGG